MKVSGSAAPGPVSLRGGLAAPERLEECDATAEARGERRFRRIGCSRGVRSAACWFLEEPALEESQLEGAGGQDEGASTPVEKRARPERLTSEP
jgi:hypothetical protein